MKNIITLIFINIVSIANAQVIMGGNTGSTTVKTSVLLEFPPNQNMGIILPYVRVLPTNPTEGTLLLDVSDPTKAHVRYYNGTWMDLSGEDADVTNFLTNQPTLAQVTESNDSKVIIGEETSTADGVLVLESTTKAMVLPIINDVQNIVNPSPGTIVYINKPGAKRLAIFSGGKWSYWKQP